MAKISEMNRPGALSGLEMLPVTYGADNARVPLSHVGQLPRGAIAVSLVNYSADTASTSNADPGAGNLRWNNAAQASATQIFISDSDVDAVGHSAVWASLASGGFLYLYDNTNLDIWQKWQITAVHDEAGYLRLEVTWQGGNDTFADDAAVVLTIQQPTPDPGVNRDVVTPVASSGGTTTLDASLGNYFTTTTSENTTLALSNVPQACTLSLKVTQGATPRTMAWPSSFKWRGGTAGAISTAASAVDRLVMTTDNYGATWQVDIGKDYK